jgi:DNA primase
MELVEQVLRDKGLSFTISGRDYIIKCLNPEHDDNNPSLRVDKISGLMHCFACGYKNSLFKQYDINPPITSIKMSKLLDNLKELRMFSKGLEPIEGAVPFKDSFRAISGKTYEHFEAFTVDGITELEDRLVFPIKDITGKIGAFVGRHTLSDGDPRYVVYPRHSRIGCYPVEMPKHTTSIVLVEGIFDALNLYDKGIKNVVCAFGTQSFKVNIRSKLLVFKLQGIDTVNIMFDGDIAGRTAAAALKPLIEAEKFKVNIIDMPDDEDPGVLKQDEVNKYKELIK